MTTPDSQKRNLLELLIGYCKYAVIGVVAVIIVTGFLYPVLFFRLSDVDEKGCKAKSEMDAIIGAYKKYHSENGQWPKSIDVVAPFIESNPNLLDPWGHPYAGMIETNRQDDGSTLERPVIYCYRPNGQKIQRPEK